MSASTIVEVVGIVLLLAFWLPILRAELRGDGILRFRGDD